MRTPDQLTALPARTRTFLAQKDFDPVAVIARLRCPLLAVYGAMDSKLPVEEHAATHCKLASRPHATITVEVLPGHDHDLRSATGQTEGASDDSEALALMALWAEAQVTAHVTSLREK